MYAYLFQLSPRCILEYQSKCMRWTVVIYRYCEIMPNDFTFLRDAAGFVSGVGKGFLRTFKINDKLVGDIVPVDYPINLMIAVAWHTAIQK